MPIELTYRYVEAHQREQGKQLDECGRLNDEMDALAKAYWAYTSPAPNRITELCPNEWYIKFNGDKVTSRVTKSVQEGIAVHNLTKWRREHKQQFNANQWNNIAWDALRMASDKWTVQ